MERELYSLEFTGILTEDIWHYTCNSSSFEILEKYRIKSIGEKYHCDTREILLIPKKLYEERGIPIREADITIQSETLLTKLK
jgi:hypothetical protein